MALFVTVVWGTTFISSKLLLAAFTPLEIMTFRFVIAWVVLFLLSPRPIKPKSLKGELPFVGAGITGLTLYFILENTALEYTLASNVGIIISAAPMFSALLLWAFRRTGRPRPTFFLGFVIAMSGIALISLAGGEGLDLDPLGNLLTLGAACAGASTGYAWRLPAARASPNSRPPGRSFSTAFSPCSPSSPSCGPPSLWPLSSERP